MKLDFTDKKTKVFIALLILLVVLFVYIVIMIGFRERHGKGAGPVGSEVTEDTGVPMEFMDGTEKELEGSKVKAFRSAEDAKRRGVNERDITNMWGDIVPGEESAGEGGVVADLFGNDKSGGKSGGGEMSTEELLRKYYGDTYIDPDEAREAAIANVGGSAVKSRSGGGGSRSASTSTASTSYKSPVTPMDQFDEPEPQAEAESLAEESPAAGGRGVVHSMREEMRAGRSGGSARAERASKALVSAKKPVRCQFVRDEELSSGMRVTVRLLDPLELDGGVVVPANSRLSASCTVGDRLGLSFAGFSQNGQLYNINYTAYDNDGLPGLYLSGGSQKSNQLADEAVSDALNVASTVAGATGIIGTVANSALNLGRQALRGSGSGKVVVPSGYTFYIVGKQ